MRSLRARFMLATIAVAVLAVLITALVSIQLVRSASNDDARQQLTADANGFSTERGIRAVSDVTVDTGVLVAVIAPDLTITGDASVYLNKAFAKRIQLERSISTIRRDNGEGAFIEARMTPSGYAVLLALPQTKIEKVVKSASNRILLALVIGAVVAILAAFLLSRLVSRPLTETAGFARRLAKGERGILPPKKQPTEIAAISEALTTLDRALATSEGQQREFLLSISHELRTPLTALRGYGEALADGLIPAHDVPDIGRTLVTETERLTLFVSDLLELARLEADDFSLNPTLVDVGALLEQVRGAWLGRATTLGVTLEAAASVGLLRTDAQRLRQVIDGLVENALRVSPTGSTISLAATLLTGSTQVSVTDGGPGLTEADLAVAFDRGALHATYRDVRPVGTGLGLSIAARLVGRMGGSIAAANVETGGAVFTVTLPTT